MAELEWTLQALDDAKAIAGFVARDSPRHALLTLRRIFDAADRLTDFPRLGRTVPEVGRTDVREIMVGSYRVVYHANAQRVLIVTVLHGARRFPQLPEVE